MREEVGLSADLYRPGRIGRATALCSSVCVYNILILTDGSQTSVEINFLEWAYIISIAFLIHRRGPSPFSHLKNIS